MPVTFSSTTADDDATMAGGPAAMTETIDIHGLTVELGGAPQVPTIVAPPRSAFVRQGTPSTVSTVGVFLESLNVIPWPHKKMLFSVSDSGNVPPVDTHVPVLHGGIQRHQHCVV